MRPFGWSHYFLIFTDWFVKSHVHFPGFSQHFSLVMFALTPVGPTICALVALPGLAFPGYLWPSGRPMLMMATWHNMGMALVVVHTFFGDFYILYGTYIHTTYPFVTNPPSNQSVSFIEVSNITIWNYWLWNALGTYCTILISRRNHHFCYALHFHLDWTAVAVESVEESPNANLNRFRPERKKNSAPSNPT